MSPVGAEGDTTPALGSLAAEVHRALLDEGPVDPATAGRRIAELVRLRSPLLGPSAVAEVVDRVRATVAGLGPLEPLLADPEVTEVMVNGPGPVWVERGGRLVRTGLHLDEALILHLVEKVVAPLGRRVDRSSPLVDARLPDGSRVNVVLPPLALDGPCLTIRRFSATAMPLEATCSPRVGALLRWAVEARMNVVVSGGTGAGKTTLLNALAAGIGRDERVVTVEDAAELRLPGEHVVRLESRPANAEGSGEVSIRDLVRNALRMRPDRLVVGEVRGAEALDMVQAMNTGHDGSLSTCHANSPADALARLETMVLMAGVGLPLPAVRRQIEGSVDLVVHVARRPDGSRGVASVAEVATDGHGGVQALADGDVVLSAPSRPPRRAGVGPFSDGPAASAEEAAA